MTSAEIERRSQPLETTHPLCAGARDSSRDPGEKGETREVTNTKEEQGEIPNAHSARLGGHEDDVADQSRHHGPAPAVGSSECQ